MEMLTNFEFLQLSRKLSPNFSNYTAEWTADKFNEVGFEALQNDDESLMILNDFYNLSLKCVLNKIETYNAKDTLEEQGFTKTYYNGYGEILQRINVIEIKPVSPAYQKLEDFKSVDPFVVRKPKAKERFFKQNYDFQNFITITDDQARKIFVNEYGVNVFINSILESLNASYAVDKYTKKLNALSAGISSTDYPLLPSQIINNEISQEPTQPQLKRLILILKNLISDMKAQPSTSAYNAMGFNRKQNISDLVVLIKPQLLNLIDTELLATIFNPEKLNINIKFVQVTNFGGIYYTDLLDNVLKPVYNELGEQIGFNASGEGEPLPVDQIKMVDPHEDINFILCDKEYVFMSEQINYSLRSIDNPRGRYRNYFASKPNGGVYVDYAFTCVVCFNRPNTKKTSKTTKND